VVAVRIVGASIGSSYKPFGTSVDTRNSGIHVPFLVSNGGPIRLSSGENLFSTAALIPELTTSYVAWQVGRRPWIRIHMAQNAIDL